MDPILVVDDNPTIRMLVSEILQQEGYLVDTAENGAAALDLVIQRRFALILLDMEMPVLDGPTFVARLQADGMHLPIVVVSGAAASAQRWAEDIQAVAFVEKPFHPSELASVVHRVTQDARALDHPPTGQPTSQEFA